MFSSVSRSTTAALAAAVTALGAAVVALQGVAAAPASAMSICMSPNPPEWCFNEPPPPPPPSVARPTGLTVTSAHSTWSTITWNDTTRDESGFRVTRTMRPTAASAAATSTTTVTPSAGQTAFTLTQYDLQPGMTVVWSIVALGAGGRVDAAPVTTGMLSVDLPDNSVALPELRTMQLDWSAGAFPNVNKALALSTAAYVVNHPLAGVDQAQTGSCGPATAEVELVRRAPAQFVTSVRSVFDTGAFTTPDGTTYTASSALRGSAKNPSVTEANWLFLATLRDSGNAVLRITGSTSATDAAWVSTPAEVDDWLAHVVGLHTTTATGIVWPFTSGQSVMPGARSVLDHGGAVVLLIDASLLGQQPGVVALPNHYVDLVSCDPGATTVTFTVASWGTTYTRTVSWGTFNALAYDVLTAS